jgi:hypothetical protein
MFMGQSSDILGQFLRGLGLNMSGFLYKTPTILDPRQLSSRGSGEPL